MIELSVAKYFKVPLHQGRFWEVVSVDLICSRVNINGSHNRKWDAATLKSQRL